MKAPANLRKSSHQLRTPLLALCILIVSAMAALGSTPVFGPFNGVASGSGAGHVKWFDGVPPTEAKDAWTISAWVKPSGTITAPTLVAGFGDGTDFIGAQRFLCADSQGWFFWYGGFKGQAGKGGKVRDNTPAPDRLATQVAVKPDVWQNVVATFDGRTLILYVDGKEAGRGEANLTRASMQPTVAPPSPWNGGASFSGKVAEFSIFGTALPAQEVARLATASQNLDALVFAPAPIGPNPVNRTDAKLFANGGRNPGVQNPSNLPKPVPPVALKRTPKITQKVTPEPASNGRLTLNSGWEMAEASTVSATPEKISSPGFDTQGWYDATVPGTALTTLVQQGVYPEPTHGLNNVLIPDLATKSWWYRVEFPTSQQWQKKNLELLFKGINYHGEIWLNGKYVGEMTGAFVRGQFDITPLLASKGNNVLAVRVWPQPHYTQGLGEASVKEGPGGNGSDGLLDGPTFFCTEGWDWLPTIKDRCTGIWQDVELIPSGAVTVNDPQVITKLPKLPDLSVAEVTLRADLRNLTAQPQSVTVDADLAGAHVSKKVSLSANGSTTVEFTPSEFPQLVLKNPKLWWPNGYGDPVLHDLKFRVLDAAGNESSQLTQRVGLRQMDYDYLADTKGADIKNTPLIIKVNGCRIFVHGGNWGLDEILKRSSTERLEPYFRLEREAGLNLIRNWTGQNTQDNFYELADQYGLLIWNDFWLSTMGFNVPAVNAEGFMANADDVIRRYRAHPSIAVWCGRNEGVPPPWLNDPLTESIKKLDGTRAYIPSSIGGNLMHSGPWTYMDPEWYYTKHSKGFCTEVGINSIPTVDALKAMLDPSQYWPWQGNDAWAYHDFPSKSHGVVKPFLEAAEAHYGVGATLEDFILRMQMENYTYHRMLFESFNSKMWQPCTGVFLWMSHPAWPSMVWQLYTSDYEPNASYFGMKKACEPIHVQWDIVDDSVSIVNTTQQVIPQASLSVTLYGLDSSVLKTVTKEVTLEPSSLAKPLKVEWADLAAQPVQFVKLELKDHAGNLLSENFYWHTDQKKPEQLRALETMPKVTLIGTATAKQESHDSVVTVKLSNPGKTIALMTHLVLRNAETGARVLPAFASDNYVSLLPGEQRTITIRCANKIVPTAMKLTLDGWNITPTTLSVTKSE